MRCPKGLAGSSPAPGTNVFGWSEGRDQTVPLFLLTGRPSELAPIEEADERVRPLTRLQRLNFLLGQKK